MYKFVKWSLSFVVSGYLLIAATAYFFQEHLMFHFAPVPETHQYHFNSSTEDVWLSSQGGQLHGILFKAHEDRKARELVVYYKGNAGNVSGSERMARLFLGMGYDVLSMDYRGFGKSRGELSEKSLLDDAERWFDWGRDNYGDENVRVVGYSMGTTFASHVAAARAAGNVILFAPMKSVVDMASRRYPFLPEFLTNYPLRSDEKLAHAPGHVVIYHGTADEVVPFASGEGLKDYLGPDDAFVPVDGANHYTVAIQTSVQADITARWGASASTLTQTLPQAGPSLSRESAPMN